MISHNIYIIAILFALGTSRATLMLVRDDIFAKLRAYVFKRSNPDTGFFGQVLSCPDCCGVWVAGLMLAGLLLCFWPFCAMLAILSASMVTSLIARRY